MPYLVERLHFVRSAIPGAQGLDVPRETLRAALRERNASSQSADGAQQSWDVRKASGFRHVNDNPQPFQFLDVTGLVPAFPGQHEVRLKRHDALDIHASGIPYLGDIARFFRVVAKARHADQAGTGAGSIGELGEAGRQRHDPLCRVLQANHGVAIIAQLDTGASCRRHKSDGTEDRKRQFNRGDAERNRTET